MLLERLLEQVNWVHVLNVINWGTQIPLLSALVVAMWRRRQHRELPFYFTYLAWVLGSSLARAPLYWWQANPRGYWWLFYSYWSVLGISIALGFLVIYEVFGGVFGGYEAFRQRGATLFRWAGAGLLLLAAVLVYLSPGTEVLRVTRALFDLNLVLRFVQAGLLLLIVVCVAWLKVPWRQPLLGITLGFGLYAVCEVARTAVRLNTGWWGNELNMLLDPTAYTCTTIIWAVSLLRRPAEATATQLPPADVEQWNQALSHLLQR